MSRNGSQISFTIHRSGWLLIAIFIAFGCRDLGPTNGALGGVLVVVSLLIHELAHTVTATLFHVPVHGIGIKFVGAYTIRKYASRPMHDVIIAASGPAASLLLTVMSFFVPKVGVWLAEWNLGIVVLNLLPFPGTDGYRILKTLFWPDSVYRAKLADTA
jgi:Zn-dependent protease